jgi:hypothetical protein
MSGRWSPGIGDPTLMGWITVLAYGLAAFFCLRICLQQNCRSNREHFGWLGLAALMAVLCINKQLDLQSLFTQVAREFARADGWYADRRLYQARFIQGFALVGGLGGSAILIFAARAHNVWARVAALGAVLIVGFVIVRAASFHHIDVFLRTPLIGLRYNWIFELTPIGLIILAAWKSASKYANTRH